MSYPQDPYQPTQPLTPLSTPHRRKPKKLWLILGVIGGLLVLCCGGLVTLGAIAGPPKPAPSAPASPAGFPSPSPTPSESPTPAAAPSTPAAPPTTTAPQPVAPPAPAPTAKVAPPPAPAPTDPEYARGVHPGAFCSPQGAMGYTNDGTLMRCTTTAADPRARWRKA